jgi:hypothetical protein
MDDVINRASLRAEYRRQVFQVFNADGWMCAYGHVSMAPAGRAREMTLQDVIDELLVVFDDPEGTENRDMAVWRDGCILAVIRKVPEGRPEVTRFVAQLPASGHPAGASLSRASAGGALSADRTSLERGGST